MINLNQTTLRLNLKIRSLQGEFSSARKYMKISDIKMRISAAWNCLQGNPTIAFGTFNKTLSLHPEIFDDKKRILIVGNQFKIETKESCIDLNRKK